MCLGVAVHWGGYVFRCWCTLGVAICVQVLLYSKGGSVFRCCCTRGVAVCLVGPSLVRTCCTLGVAICLVGPNLVRTCCTLEHGYVFRWSKFGQDCCTLGVAMCVQVVQIWSGLAVHWRWLCTRAGHVLQPDAGHLAAAGGCSLAGPQVGQRVL